MPRKLFLNFIHLERFSHMAMNELFQPLPSLTSGEYFCLLFMMPCSVYVLLMPDNFEALFNSLKSVYIHEVIPYK